MKAAHLLGTLHTNSFFEIIAWSTPHTLGVKLQVVDFTVRIVQSLKVVYRKALSLVVTENVALIANVAKFPGFVELASDDRILNQKALVLIDVISLFALETHEGIFVGGFETIRNGNLNAVGDAVLLH